MARPQTAWRGPGNGPQAVRFLPPAGTAIAGQEGTPV